MESILEVLTPDNLVFIFKGFGLTLYISLIAIILSTIIGTVLAVMRNGKNPVLRIISSIYIEFVRNVPNLLWIFTIFLVFKMKSTPAGITAFTLFTSAALVEIIRGGLNAVDKGQYEVGMSQGFTSAQILYYIILPQAIRKMLPAIISQFVTVIKDTSLLYSVIALQELFGASQILMGRYFEPEQVFSLYILIALIYFSFNLAISSLSHMLAKRWQQAADLYSSKISQTTSTSRKSLQTTSALPCRTQVQPAASFLICSLIFIEYKQPLSSSIGEFFDDSRYL
ncbi:ABC-type amino acid transporter, membrane-spanning permease [Streptococcus pneumoniae]|nr:ABC-type amino acid transporter, membrane-spanning permease [Streptococcus pneumoniae]